MVADGMTLVIVERPHRLPPELLAELRRRAAATVGALRGEHRRRTRSANGAAPVMQAERELHR
jgi:hypothetical protein